MENNVLEISAMMKVRKGKLQEFKQQAAEIIRLTKEKDTKTLRYDWFLNIDGTECEVREVYENSEGLIEHRMHIGEALQKLFAEVADDHTVRIFGELSPELREMVKNHKDVNIKRYLFFKGLEAETWFELNTGII